MVAASAQNTKPSERISTLEFGIHSSGINDFNYWDHLVSEPDLNGAVIESKNICHHLMELLEACLSKCKHTKLHCSKVFVPEKLTKRIAEDILRLSSSEPCGLQGCVILVNLEADNQCKKIDTIIYDSSVVPTFELILVLKQDGGTWPNLRDFFHTRTGFMFSFWRVLKLVPSFRLLKRKLYSSSAGTVIEECNV